MTTEVTLPYKWLVIGSGSLVGSRFIELACGGNNIYGAGGEADKNNPNLVEFSELDVTDEEAVKRVISNFPGNHVINFAGVTIVEQIEKTRPIDPFNQQELDQNLAYRVNVIGTRNIIKACQETGKFPIFISTGFVFDGTNGPYSEDDPIATDPNQVSWYAWTKVLAEKEVSNSGIENITIRISYPYRSEFDGKTDFARSFLSLYDGIQKGEKQWYPIFTDQKLTPTFIDDLPEAVLTLVEDDARGIFHLTSPEITDPYQFCCEVLRVARGVEDPESIVPKGLLVKYMEEHPEAPLKPLDGGELVDKIVSLGFIPTNWKMGIKKAFEKA